MIEYEYKKKDLKNKNPRIRNLREKNPQEKKTQKKIPKAIPNYWHGYKKKK